MLKLQFPECPLGAETTYTFKNWTLQQKSNTILSLSAHTEWGRSYYDSVIYQILKLMSFGPSEAQMTWLTGSHAVAVREETEGLFTSSWLKARLSQLFHYDIQQQSTLKLQKQIADIPEATSMFRMSLHTWFNPQLEQASQ